MPPEHEILPEHTRRLRLAPGLLIGLMLVLTGGLAYRQLYRAPQDIARVERQSHRRVMDPGPRGRLLDRDHRVLADNRIVTSVVVNLGNLRPDFQREQNRLPATGSSTPAQRAAAARREVVQRQLDRINTTIARHESLDAVKLERAFGQERMAPFPLATDLTERELDQLRVVLDPAGPIQLLRTNRRWYPHGSLAAHVLGRVRPEMIRPASDPAFATSNYPDAVGDSGLEKQFDGRLRGHAGDALVKVDALGFPVGRPQVKHDPSPGEDIVLSLDLDLQQAAERALAATPGTPRGAAVVIEVATGEVLAMASKPDFDLNDVTLAIAPAVKQRIEAEGAWLNRATQALYPPGSSFKVFTALAGLRAGTLHPGDLLHCDGFYQVGGRRFPCHNPAGHGNLALREALAHSCNVFAYQVGLAAGPEALATEARRFHFDTLTGIDLPGETRGMLVADPAWKKSHGEGDWTPGDTANLAIGQGYLRCSPLQAACAMASLARRETLTVPTLLHQSGRKPTGDRPTESLGISDGNYAALVAGLQAVVETGIGREAQVPGIRIAGKTGTAQIQRKEGMMNVAWFIAFAPVEKPVIALAVALEGGQPGVEFAGAEHAAPVAGEIMAAYFEKRAGKSGK